MRFTILTLFPDIVGAYVGESILKRAQKNGKIKVEVIDIRKFTKDKHNTADDRVYGGGPGMVMKAEPILKAYDSIKRKGSKPRVIITSAAGKVFTNKLALGYTKKYNHLILIAGHYEGIDERVKKALKAEEISIGDYVLTGGELPALVMVDSIARQIKGVLGKSDSLEENRDGVGVPVYTRPEVFTYKKKRYSVPSELASGNHAKIEEWRRKHKK
ncbi:MAG: tRNA (guanosine(37)-N1)-methyltransferase TrmD [bacterium]|nr:tRNA (guanosine(37)-N1)-methyltransferase TrmD [bacterium]